jgi:hypothetical protein
MAMLSIEAYWQVSPFSNCTVSASAPEKRTRTAADGDMHEASSKNSDGTQHLMIGESQTNVPRCPFLEGQQNNSLLETTADSVVHEGGLQAEP